MHAATSHARPATRSPRWRRSIDLCCIGKPSLSLMRLPGACHRPRKRPSTGWMGAYLPAAATLPVAAPAFLLLRAVAGRRPPVVLALRVPRRPMEPDAVTAPLGLVAVAAGSPAAA